MGGPGIGVRGPRATNLMGASNVPPEANLILIFLMVAEYFLNFCNIEDKFFNGILQVWMMCDVGGPP
jgi:hypothetical protein